MHPNKQVGRGGRSKASAEPGEQEWNFQTIRKEVENFSSTCLTWKEKKDLENKKVTQLGGKAPKKQRLPLSVARPAMKNKKQRDEKLMKERLALGRFGVLLGGESNTSKRHVDKRKPIDMGLRASQGNFVNGCLHVDRLLKASTSHNRKEADNSSHSMAKKGKKSQGKRNGGKKNQKNKKRH